MSKYRSITFGVACVIFALCLSGFGLSQQGSKKARAERKTNAALGIQVAASRRLVKLPPRSVDPASLYCELTEKEVTLLANATSPNREEINFTWQVPVGVLKGKGREVTWDLSGVREGTYTATVEASDKHKHTARESVEVVVVICPGWDPPPPPCPTVSVSCPSSNEPNGSVTFVANVDVGNSKVTPTYEWSLSAGKIVSGQGKPKLIVDVSGHDEPVVATVSVGGFDPACATVASCTINIH